MNLKLMQRYGDLGLNSNNQAISSIDCCDRRGYLRQSAEGALILVVKDWLPAQFVRKMKKSLEVSGEFLIFANRNNS